MICFFFSSRRRHTSWPRDWSSDVCSSDLGHIVQHGLPAIPAGAVVLVGEGSAKAIATIDRTGAADGQQDPAMVFVDQARMGGAVPVCHGVVSVALSG